jgi:protein O-mannosyl-transferase
LFAYCILFFIVNHLIESTIFSLELIFEHRNYLPSMLFFIPVAAGLCYLLDHFAHRKRMKYVLCAFIVLLLVGFGHSTFMRNFTWKNGESLWIDASEKAPGEFRVHHNLGRFYQDHGFRQAAIEEYKKALQAPVGHRRDEEIVTHYNLAKLSALLDRLGETESANALLRRVLEFDPCDGHANLNTGLHYLRIKEHDKAIQHLTKARESVALEGDRLLYLGIAYKQRGEYGRSSIYLRRALDLRHRAMDAHLHLAEVYARTGLPAKAELEAEKAIELLMEDKRHLYRIIRQMTEPAETLHAEPALEIILPFISKVLGKRSAELNELEELIDETLHHLAGVERP